MQHLDQDINVVMWEYESFRIPYFYHLEGVQRWYVPDFLMTHLSGEKILMEVKPREFVDGERARLKSQAAEKWCAENNARFLLVTRQVMNSMGLQPR